MTDEETREFSDEELEALAGEELPDRKAMATVNTDSCGFEGFTFEEPDGLEPPER